MVGKEKTVGVYGKNTKSNLKHNNNIVSHHGNERFYFNE